MSDTDSRWQPNWEQIGPADNEDDWEVVLLTPTEAAASGLIPEPEEP